MDKFLSERESEAPRHQGLYPWFILLVLSAAMALSLIDRFALSLLFEPIKTDLGLSDTQLGLLHGVAFGLFYAAMGIPIAWLIDVWSRKWVIVWGIGLWSFMTALCGLAKSYLALIGARIGVGVGEAALAPAGYSMITDLFSRERLATAISIFQMGSLLGGGLAFIAGGAVLQAVESWDLSAWGFLDGLAPWRLTFIIVALPGILFVLLFFLIREPKRVGEVAASTAPQEEMASTKTGLFRYLGKRWLLYASLFIGNACLISVSYANVTWSPTLLIRNYDWEITTAGFRFGLLMLTVAPAGVLLGGALADWWLRKGINDAYPRVLLIASIATLPFLVLLQLADSAMTALTAIGVVQFTVSMVIGTGPAATQTITRPDVRARVSAVYVFAVNLVGLGIGPIAIGVMSDSVFARPDGLLSSIVAFSGSMCLVSLLLFLVFRSQHRTVGGQLN